MNEEDENNFNLDFESKPNNNTSYPMIAGILLILAGLISISFWGFTVATLDSTFEMIDMSEINQMNQSITLDEIKPVVNTCFTILIILSIFPILGGILSIRKKLMPIAILSGILGILSFGMLFISPLLSIIALILIYMSRNEFN